MALTVYATESDLDSFGLANIPDEVDRYLRAATFDIAEATNRNPYTDVPSDTDAPVLRDATCAQIAAWVALGIDPDRRSVDGAQPVKKSTILSADVEYDTTVRDEGRSLAGRKLMPQAEAILTAAGLLWLPTAVSSADDCLPTYGLSGPGRRHVDIEWANTVDAWPFL